MFNTLRGISMQFLGLDQKINKIRNLNQVYLTGKLQESRNLPSVDLINLIISIN